MASAKASQAARRPDYNLSCMDKESGDKSGHIGAAWRNADGSIRLKIPPGVVLTHALNVVLWPVEQTEDQAIAQGVRSASKRTRSTPDDPFGDQL